MPLVALDLRITSNAPGVVLSRGAGRKWLNDVTGATLRDAATEWHRRRFPERFTRSAPAEFRYEPRSEFYLNVIKKFKGEGAGKQKGLLQILTGRSKRRMLAFAQISNTAKRVTLKMRPPAYFANPFIGVIGRDKRTGKTKRIARQPDKVAEVTRTSERDNQSLQEFAQRSMLRRIRDLPPPVTKTIK